MSGRQRIRPWNGPRGAPLPCVGIDVPVKQIELTGRDYLGIARLCELAARGARHDGNEGLAAALRREAGSLRRMGVEG